MSPENNFPPESDRPAPSNDLPTYESSVEQNPSYSPDVLNLEREPNSAPQANEVEPPESTQTYDESPAQEIEPSSSIQEKAEPAAQTNVVTPAAATKRKSKKFLIPGIAAAVLAVIVGGGAAVYGLWYQNPQKVVTDAIVNMMKAESTTFDGSLNITNLGDVGSSVDKLTLTIDGSATRSSGQMDAKLSVKSGGKTYALDGSALVDNDANLYFKVKNIESLAKEYMGMGQGSMETLNPIIDKIDDKWVRVAAEDYEEVSQETSKVQKCFADTIKKHENNSETQSQISNAYRESQFIVIKEELGVRDGNIGYQIDTDGDKMKSFVRDLQNTQIYKDLQACDDDFEINPEDIGNQRTDATDAKLEVWISRIDHELRQTKMTIADDEAKGELTINTQFNQDVNVDTPKDAVPLKELVDEVMQMMMESPQQNQEPATLQPASTVEIIET